MNDLVQAGSSVSASERNYLPLCSSGFTLLICSGLRDIGLRGDCLVVREEEAGAGVGMRVGLKMLSRRSGCIDVCASVVRGK